MKYFVVCLVLFSMAVPLFSQEQPMLVDKKAHKIVIQLTSGDSLVQKAMVRQIANILTAAPNSKIEVVCHSNGINFLLSAQTKQAAKIAELKSKGVEFMACQNTMRERQIKPEELVPQSGQVPSGVLEVVKKQEKHWAYLKAGF